MHQRKKHKGAENSLLSPFTQHRASLGTPRAHAETPPRPPPKGLIFSSNNEVTLGLGGGITAVYLSVDSSSIVLTGLALVQQYSSTAFGVGIFLASFVKVEDAQYSKRVDTKIRT